MIKSTNEKAPELELWLPEIKKYIFEIFGPILKPGGYSFRQVDGSYKREHGRDYQDITFLFANQFPLNYRLSFLMEVWNHQIKSVKSSFSQQNLIEKYKLRSLVLFMFDFMPKPNADVDRKKMNNFTLVTFKDLFVATESIIGMMQKQVLPLADQLYSLDGIDQFFADRPGWSVNNLNPNNMITELAAAKLNHKRNYQEVFQDMMERVKEKIANMEMSTDTRHAMEAFNKHIKNKR
ncbi:MAG: hypothetical protein ACHQEM_07090 [Chitinophagales bacterium]